MKLLRRCTYQPALIRTALFPESMPTKATDWEAQGTWYLLSKCTYSTRCDLDSSTSGI